MANFSERKNISIRKPNAEIMHSTKIKMNAGGLKRFRINCWNTIITMRITIDSNKTSKKQTKTVVAKNFPKSTWLRKNIIYFKGKGTKLKIGKWFKETP